MNKKGENSKVLLIVLAIAAVLLFSGNLTGNALLGTTQKAQIQQLQYTANIPTQLKELDTKVSTLSSQLKGIAGAFEVTRNDLLNHIGNEEIANLETPEPEPLAAYSCLPQDPNFKVCGGTCNPTTQGTCKSGDFFSDDYAFCTRKGWTTTPCPEPDGVYDGCYCY